ncbi:MAG: GNAT family N-acetyltransferase [Bacteroidales bacterium]|nr:GNAT family N-acetyltransferase [Bacteroidales bacterium]
MSQLDIQEIRTPADLGELTKQQFVDFLHDHLDRFGDSKSAINKAIDYAFSEAEGKGGFLLAAYYNNDLAGALVMNKTGMSEYVPENILVYVAVNSKYRGKGLGGEIIKKSFELAQGDIKLHVEYDNPAKRLYEKLGMKTKYAEMRLEKKKKH